MRSTARSPPICARRSPPARSARPWLPAEGTLAEQYGVSRGTVRQALAVLRSDGLVTSRRGTRRVVLGTARVQSFSELLSFTHWAYSMGEEPGGILDSLVRPWPTQPSASSCAWRPAPRCTSPSGCARSPARR